MTAVEPLAPDINWTFIAQLKHIQEQYPTYMALLSQPGVFDVFSRAITEPTAWPPDRVLAEIQKTPWYINTNASDRAFFLLNATDPSTARQTVQNADQTVRREAASLGLLYQLDENELALFSLHAAAQGWDASRIRTELVGMQRANQLGYEPAGEIASLMTNFNGIADQYGVRMTGDALDWWASNVAVGNQTKESFEEYVRIQARNLYPQLIPAIDNGITVAQYAQPYFAMAVDELGINPAQIDLRNPMWTDLFLTTNDKNEPTIRSMTEALTQLRSDQRYGYDQSLPGRTQAAQLATTILENFGAKG